MKPPTDQRPPEADPLWDLLAQSPPAQASPAFSQNVARAARLAAPAAGRRWLTFPRLLGGLAAAAAAAVAFLAWPASDPVGKLASTPAPAATTATPAESFADLQAVAEEELLLAAAENLSQFSDAELLVLLGF
jgi:hypothetical protein